MDKYFYNSLKNVMLLLQKSALVIEWTVPNRFINIVSAVVFTMTANSHIPAIKCAYLALLAGLSP